MKKRILIIDDKPEDLDVMKYVLQKQGYNVTTATDGAEGLTKIKKDHFNLILLDINLEKISGYELSKIVRKKLKRDVKIIYISITPKQEVDTANVDGFIQKPFSIDSFISDVNKTLA